MTQVSFYLYGPTSEVFRIETGREFTERPAVSVADTLPADVRDGVYALQYAPDRVIQSTDWVACLVENQNVTAMLQGFLNWPEVLTLASGFRMDHRSWGRLFGMLRGRPTIEHPHFTLLGYEATARFF